MQFFILLFRESEKLRKWIAMKDLEECWMKGERSGWLMCGGGDGGASGRRESARRWGRRGALQACWVVECRQLEEELMGMVSAGSGVTGESFSTLPLTAPRLSSLWNSAPPAPTQVCVCCVCFSLTLFYKFLFAYKTVIYLIWTRY